MAELKSQYRPGQARRGYLLFQVAIEISSEITSDGCPRQEESCNDSP